MNRIQPISFLRVVNAAFASLIYLINRCITHVKPSNNPVTLTLEIASICNLKCPECPTGMGIVRRESKLMTPQLAQSIIERHASTTLVSILYFQGEPMLNPNWGEIALMASKHKIFTLMSSNGTLLTKENCIQLINAKVDKLIVSVDGVTQESYEKYRVGGNLEQIISGIQRLAETKKELRSKLPKIVVQTLLNKNTEHQQQQITESAKQWGANSVEFKTMQLYDQSWENIQHWLPEAKKYRRYSIANKALVLKQRKSRTCWRMLTNAVYTSDGVLVPCCFDKTAHHNFGTLVSDAWQSKERNQFITNMYHRKYVDICKNCTER